MPTVRVKNRAVLDFGYLWYLADSEIEQALALISSEHARRSNRNAAIENIKDLLAEYGIKPSELGRHNSEALAAASSTGRPASGNA